jgi:hypothetical protein
MPIRIPAHWLDALHWSTDQMLPERARARSVGQRRELTVTPGEPDTPAHLRMGRLTRFANRPSRQEVRAKREDLSSLGLPPPDPTPRGSDRPRCFAPYRLAQAALSLRRSR